MGQVADEGKLLLNSVLPLPSVKMAPGADLPPSFSPPPNSRQLSLQRWVINPLLFIKIYNIALQLYDQASPLIGHSISRGREPWTWTFLYIYMIPNSWIEQPVIERPLCFHAAAFTGFFPPHASPPFHGHLEFSVDRAEAPRARASSRTWPDPSRAPLSPCWHVLARWVERAVVRQWPRGAPVSLRRLSWILPFATTSLHLPTSSSSPLLLLLIIIITSSPPLFTSHHKVRQMKLACTCWQTAVGQITPVFLCLNNTFYWFLVQTSRRTITW